MKKKRKRLKVVARATSAYWISLRVQTDAGRRMMHYYIGTEGTSTANRVYLNEGDEISGDWVETVLDLESHMATAYPGETVQAIQHLTVRGAVDIASFVASE